MFTMQGNGTIDLIGDIDVNLESQ